MTSNFFASLVDPAGVLDVCAQSGALDALPVSVTYSADRASTKVNSDMAEHDAALDDAYRHVIEKVSKTSVVKVRKTAQEA